MTFNYSTYNITNYTDFFAFANTASAGWFFTIILLLMFFVGYFNFAKTNSFNMSIVASAFICVVTGLLLSIMGLVDFSVFVRFLILLAASTWLFKKIAV